MKKLLPNYGILLLCLLILTSCSKEEEQETTIKIPQQFIENLSSVSSGEGIPGLRPYNTLSDFINPIVVLDSQGKRMAWTDSIQDNWVPQGFDDIVLVAYVSDEWLRNTKMCEYTGNSTVEHTFYQRDVVIREAATGEIIRTRNLVPNNGNCRFQLDRKTKSVVMHVVFHHLCFDIDFMVNADCGS